MSESHTNDESEITLPGIHSAIIPSITQLTNYLQIPRNVLASDEEINYAWRNLPRELALIPSDVSKELIARMLIAISTGLFDSAINYIWNISIIKLRSKVRNFGLPIVAQIQHKNFEEKNLIALQDSELLNLCHQLNILDDEGYFFLDQCRDTRNNFSAAHPPLGNINDRELIVFINRCCLHALSNNPSPQGVNFSEFINTLNGQRFSNDQLNHWKECLESTHEAQRQLLFTSAFGIYCDPDSTQTSRLNALDLCIACKNSLTSIITSSLIDIHSDYRSKGDDARGQASLQFFEKSDLLYLLTDSEKHTIYSTAISNLWKIHKGLDNFYNEPTFAKRLFDLSQSGEIPDTIKEQYVKTVIGCFIGNGYGVSWAAEEYYKKMIQEFSPKEVLILINLAKDQEEIKLRLKSYQLCRTQFKEALELLDKESIPRSSKSEYEMLLKELPDNL